MKNSNRIIISIFLILFNAIFLFAGDWPQWRGPHRDGISSETNLLKEWPQDGPHLIWQVKDLGSGYSTPSVEGNRIYIMTNEGMDNEFVKALEVETGKLIWKTRVGKVGLPDQQPNFPAARSTPTVDKDAIYALGSDGDLVCLDKKSGQIRWSENIRQKFNGQPGKWAYAESPLVDGEKVVCVPGGKEATLIALDKKNGELIWQAAVPGGSDAGYASIVIAMAGSNKQYIAFLINGLVGVDAETGKFLWLYDQTKDVATIPTPVVQNNYVYSGTRKACGLLKIVTEQDSVDIEEVYQVSNLPSTIGGSILLGDYLFGTDAKNIICANFLTGEIMWKEPGIAPASLCYAEGRLYLHGENGTVALIEASTEVYNELGRFSPPDQPERTNNMEKAWTYPVVANGRLYIRDHDILWCYDVKE